MIETPTYRLFHRPLFAVLLAGWLAACGGRELSVTPSGLQFRIFRSDGPDSFARLGQTAKIHFTQQVGDRVIESTQDKMPLYWLVLPGPGNHYNPLEVFEYGLKKGDSVVTVQIVDTMLKKGIFKSMPAWMKSGDRWVTRFRVVGIFKSDSLLQADKIRETMKVTWLQTQKGEQRIRAFLAERRLAFEAPDTAIFLQSLQAGTQTRAAKNEEIKAVVSLKTLKDTVIRVNDTVSFKKDADYFPPLIQRHLPELSRGARFRIYLPAVLIMGVNPVDPRIKADDDLVFEMQVL